MARHVKKSRRTRRRRHSRRRSHRKQQGGSCAAMPQMNQAFPQRGGMAPITQGDSYLLDAPTRVQAEVGPLDKSFAELPSVIPKQGGGYRKSRRHCKVKSRRHHKGRRTYRRQQGGMMDFDAAYRYTPQGYVGENAQIHTEQNVNPMFKIAGAQA